MSRVQRTPHVPPPGAVRVNGPPPCAPLMLSHRSHETLDILKISLLVAARRAMRHMAHSTAPGADTPHRMADNAA